MRALSSGIMIIPAAGCLILGRDRGHNRLVRMMKNERFPFLLQRMFNRPLMIDEQKGAIIVAGIAERLWPGAELAHQRHDAAQPRDGLR